MIFLTRVSNQTPGEMFIETDIHQCFAASRHTRPQQQTLKASEVKSGFWAG
jgi:hypothetical protein